MLSVASATLAVILCAPTDDPCRIAWTIDTPMFWISCLVDHGRDVLVTSVLPLADDPLWVELSMWAAQDAPPSLGSPLESCVAQAIAACGANGVKSVTFTAGATESSCKFECYPPAPPIPPSKEVD